MESAATPPTARPGFAATAWALCAAFGAYFCMYGFRKPYTAAGWEGEGVAGLDWKTVLVIAQVVGYTLSKFIGIKVISELPASRRALGILVLVALAEGALVGFALLPAPWSALMLFLNGLPLGMVFGLVLGFLEGRRLTEILAAGLCASFIMADGFTKSVGAALLGAGVPEVWMPAAAGALFFLPLAAAVWMLARVDPPDGHDVAARSARTTLDGPARRALFARHAPALVCIIAMYLLVTVLRSVRADFAREIWQGLTGTAALPTLFTSTETWVAAGVMLATASLVMVTDNRRAFFLSLATCGIGLGVALVAGVLAAAGRLPATALVILVGVGVYLPYVAVHVSLFERLLAVSRDRGTSTYLLQLADSFGYLGYVAVLLLKVAAGMGGADPAALGRSFPTVVAGTAVVGLALVAAAWGFCLRGLPAGAERSR